MSKSKGKLPSGTTARAVPEWFGKTPDTQAPPQVQMRILARQKGRCAITEHKFAPGDKKRLDHVIPAADGGVNRESNLQWILDIDHKSKTAKEAAERAKVRARAASHAGIAKGAVKKIESRNDLPRAPTDSKITGQPKGQKLPPPTHLPTELERRYGIRETTKRK